MAVLYVYSVFSFYFLNQIKNQLPVHFQVEYCIIVTPTLMGVCPFLESAVTVPYNKQRPLGKTNTAPRADICLSSAGS